MSGRNIVLSNSYNIIARVAPSNVCISDLSDADVIQADTTQTLLAQLGNVSSGSLRSMYVSIDSFSSRNIYKVYDRPTASLGIVMARSSWMYQLAPVCKT